jgi:hypothetical protein
MEMTGTPECRDDVEISVNDASRVGNEPIASTITVLLSPVCCEGVRTIGGRSFLRDHSFIEHDLFGDPFFGDNPCACSLRLLDPFSFRLLSLLSSPLLVS